MITKRMEDFVLWLGILSRVIEWTGVGIILVISTWDVLMQGARGFFEYAIGWKGIVGIWLGVALILTAQRADMYFEEE